MSTREIAYNLIDNMTEEQLKGFIMLFGNLMNIPEEEPDEFDMALIADSMTDNEETMSLDEFVKTLWIDKN
ncbi:MAG: hypothetical protein K2O60_02715 [Ruminococcus sp.]|nr:hypothetical protein [Ruminococcus sp.]